MNCKLSNNQVKWLRSLQQKKNRDAERVFVAEGEKLVSDLMPYFRLKCLVTNSHSATHPHSDEGRNLQSAIHHFLDSDLCQNEATTYIATGTQMSQISSMKTPQGILAVFEQKPLSMGLGLGKVPSLGEGVGVRSTDWLLVLDGVQDPGNLGTIIRTADWFGFHNIICSGNTADCYNPKVVQATMGALGRVDVHYTDLNAFLTSCQAMNLPIYGTLLNGKSLYNNTLPQKGILIMGNEGNGISPEIRCFITHPTLIPSYPPNTPTSESLNVATATAIMLAEIRRKR